MGDKTQNFRRLGKRELGPHAFEQRMPMRIADCIHAEASQNKLTGVIPILARILEQDKRVTTAYLCDGATPQVYKLSAEGNHFCAYRNMQMLLLHERHTIPELQDMIEKAWDEGFNSHGRIETGGIKGTRKHIGTSEVAQALLQSRDVLCTARLLTGKKAWQDLLDAVWAYFSPTPKSESSATASPIYQTMLPPIFLQRPRHSITVVGIERLRNGKRRLLVFDPAYRPPAALKKRPYNSPSLVSAWLILWRYRRDETYLKRYRSFEILFLDEVTNTPVKPLEYSTNFSS